MTPGQLIKARREQIGLSVKDAAEKARDGDKGGYRYWYEVEGDEKCPTLRTLHRMAQALDCATADLIPPDTDLKIFFSGTV